jgi:molybdate/tungstate transport system permease protein
MAMSPLTSRFNGVRDGFGVAVLLGGVLLLYYLVPLVALFVAEPPAQVIDRLGDADVGRAAGVSLGAAGATAGVSLLLGVPLAYALARSQHAWKRVVTALVVVPLVFPPIVSGMLLLTLFNPNSLIGGVAAAGGVPLTRSFVAVVLAQTFVASPFVVITAKAAFEGVPRAYEYASRSLGKSRWATFWRVTIPLAWPGILAGVTLAFARAIGEFGATIMMAYYPRTLPVQIWVAFTTLGLDAAFPVALLLAAISIAALVVLNTIGANPWTQ